MIPPIVDRDTKYFDWVTVQLALSTTDSAIHSGSVRMKSDGIVYPDTVSAYVKDVDTLTAGRMSSAGVHLASPLGNDDYTMYKYSCSMTSEDPEISPYLFIGIGIAAPTADAGGDLVTNVHYIGMPTALGLQNVLEVDGIFALQKTDAVAADRAVVFGMGFATGISSATAGSSLYGRIDVRRLVKNKIQIYDNRKQ